MYYFLHWNHDEKIGYAVFFSGVKRVKNYEPGKIYIWRNIYPDATQISLDWSINAPFTVLQIVNPKTFSEDFTCKVFSISIPSSDNWNPLKKSRDSWFGAYWREGLCFNQVRSVWRPGECSFISIFSLVFKFFKFRASIL